MYVEYLKKKDCPKIPDAASYKTPHCIIRTALPGMLASPMKITVN